MHLVGFPSSRETAKKQPNLARPRCIRFFPLLGIGLGNWRRRRLSPARWSANNHFGPEKRRGSSPPAYSKKRAGNFIGDVIGPRPSSSLAGKWEE